MSDTISDGETTEQLHNDLLCTDVGNGEAFANACRDRYRYLGDREVWLRWDGRRWRKATKGDLMRSATRYAKWSYRAALEVAPNSKDILAWAKKSTGHKALTTMITLAAAHLEVESADFDTHRHLLNVKNGTLNLETGELRPHDPNDRLTTVTMIDYDPTATASRWDRFLDEIFAKDKDLIAFVQRAVGLSLTGFTREQCFFILHGSGENGKGRFIAQLRKLLGDAAKTTAITTLAAKKKTTENTPALARLANARLVTAGEPDEEMRFSEATIKELTGEDEIEVCAKYEHPFNYVPKFKAWIHCNHKPKIKGTDHGIWRRPKLIPFNVTFDGKPGKPGNPGNPKPDKKLDEKLNDEAAGILAWAVEGAKNWFRDGLGTCKIVEDAISAYRSESDQVGRFLEDWSEEGGAGKFVSNKQIYAAYTAWCFAQGEKREDILEIRALGKRLAEKGFLLDKKKGVRGVFGIKLSAAAVIASVAQSN